MSVVRASPMGGTRLAVCIVGEGRRGPGRRVDDHLVPERQALGQLSLGLPPWGFAGRASVRRRSRGWCSSQCMWWRWVATPAGSPGRRAGRWPRGAEGALVDLRALEVGVCRDSHAGQAGVVTGTQKFEPVGVAGSWAARNSSTCRRKSVGGHRACLCRRSSVRASAFLCTSSGPSANRRVRLRA